MRISSGGSCGDCEGCDSVAVVGIVGFGVSLCEKRLVNEDMLKSPFREGWTQSMSES